MQLKQSYLAQQNRKYIYIYIENKDVWKCQYKNACFYKNAFSRENYSNYFIESELLLCIIG